MFQGYILNPRASGWNTRISGSLMKILVYSSRSTMLMARIFCCTNNYSNERFLQLQNIQWTFRRGSAAGLVQGLDSSRPSEWLYLFQRLQLESDGLQLGQHLFLHARIMFSNVEHLVQFSDQYLHVRQLLWAFLKRNDARSNVPRWISDTNVADEVGKLKDLHHRITP